MLVDAMMMGTTSMDKYHPSADLLESVGVKAMKVSEPTTTLSALLGSLGGMVFCEIHLKLWNLIFLGYYDTDVNIAPDLRARGLGGIRPCFPRFAVLLGLGILPPSFPNASSMFSRNDLCPDIDQNADRYRICFL